MDPYETLGVARNCSRKEAKETFRARARSAHPDRGGDIPSFIRLRQAYEQIMSELDRAPPLAANLAPKRAPQPARSDRPPDPNWEPELIVRDEPLPRIVPPHPPEPNWEPELILVDLDSGTGQVHAAARTAADGRYSAWLRRIWERSPDRGSPGGVTRLDVAGLLALGIVLVLLCLALYWAATAEDAPSGEPAERPIVPARPAQGAPSVDRIAFRLTANCNQRAKRDMMLHSHDSGPARRLTDRWRYSRDHVSFQHASGN